MNELIKELRTLAKAQVRDSEYSPDKTIAWCAADRIIKLEEHIAAGIEHVAELKARIKELEAIHNE